MRCLRCGTESKWEFCRKCKEEQHRAWAIISQNKKKLRNLLDQNILQPELYEKFILYTDNIKKQWEIYMSFVAKKRYRILGFACWTTLLASLIISLYSIISLVILKI